jgi:hypothetical protein
VPKADILRCSKDWRYSINLVGGGEQLAGIFDYLIATAQDQETKEAALAYHFIRKAEVAPRATEVADRIEAWLANNFSVDLDFKVSDALRILDRFGLMRREGELLFVPPLEPAIAQLSQVWNNFFKRE